MAVYSAALYSRTEIFVQIAAGRVTVNGGMRYLVKE